jgi:hypothetical protein
LGVSQSLGFLSGREVNFLYLYISYLEGMSLDNPGHNHSRHESELGRHYNRSRRTTQWQALHRITHPPTEENSGRSAEDFDTVAGSLAPTEAPPPAPLPTTTTRGSPPQAPAPSQASTSSTATPQAPAPSRAPTSGSAPPSTPQTPRGIFIFRNLSTSPMSMNDEDYEHTRDMPDRNVNSYDAARSFLAELPYSLRTRRTGTNVSQGRQSTGPNRSVPPPERYNLPEDAGNHTKTE